MAANNVNSRLLTGQAPWGPAMTLAKKLQPKQCLWLCSLGAVWIIIATISHVPRHHPFVISSDSTETFSNPISHHSLYILFILHNNLKVWLVSTLRAIFYNVQTKLPNKVDSNSEMWQLTMWTPCCSHQPSFILSELCWDFHNSSIVIAKWHFAHSHNSTFTQLMLLCENEATLGLVLKRFAL